MASAAASSGRASEVRAGRTRKSREGSEGGSGGRGKRGFRVGADGFEERILNCFAFAAAAGFKRRAGEGEGKGRQSLVGGERLLGIHANMGETCVAVLGG